MNSHQKPLVFSASGPTRRLAYFITPHGFGHAARASAVMAATQARAPEWRFEIFTKVPEWFFAEVLPGEFGYHATMTDVGLIQPSPTQENLSATLKVLGGLLPFAPEMLHTLAKQVRALGCEGVLCDIAPLGLAVAQTAGLPSILLENFTWDWIYEGYLHEEPAFAKFIEILGQWNHSATWHLQAQPICQPHPQAHCTTPPISRRLQPEAIPIRERLGVAQGEPLVLLTMGGIPEQYRFLERLLNHREARFVIPGGSSHLEYRQNLILLPHRSDFYHPNLLQACDGVIGKAGYSTLAETYYAGVPFGVVQRPRFRESPILERYLQQEMQGFTIHEAEFQTGDWLEALPQLLAMPRLSRSHPNGAEIAAEFLLSCFGRL